MAVSPPLQWAYAPEDTGSFVLLLTGPENHRRGVTPSRFSGPLEHPG